MNLTLLQIISAPICKALSSPATLLFNRQIRDLLPKMNREPVNIITMILNVKPLTRQD